MPACFFYSDGNKCVICNSFQLLRLFNWVGSNYALAISIINYALITQVFMLVTAGFGTDGGSAVWFQPIAVAISVPAEETGQVDLGMFFNCASDAGSGETCWYACQSQHSDCHNSSESSTHLTLSSTFLPFLGFIVSDKIWAVRRWVSASLQRALLKESASNALHRAVRPLKTSYSVWRLGTFQPLSYYSSNINKACWAFISLISWRWWMHIQNSELVEVWDS